MHCKVPVRFHPKLAAQVLIAIVAGVAGFALETRPKPVPEPAEPLTQSRYRRLRYAPPFAAGGLLLNPFRHLACEIENNWIKLHIFHLLNYSMLAFSNMTLSR